MTIEQALAWADQTMNERLREARRTGNDHDYDAAMEGCIDILAAEVRRLRPYYTLVHDSWDEVCDDGCDSWGHAETCKCVNLTQAFIAAKADLTALRESHAAAVSHGRSEMSDDLLDTVSKALALDTGCLCGLPQCAECRAWSPLVENRNILRALLARCEAAEAERDAARAEAETERMRLVACGVAAMQNTEAAATERIGRDNPCWSASYGDVCASVDREMAHRAEAARLREAIQFALDSPSDMSGEDIRILLAALRGEGR